MTNKKLNIEEQLKLREELDAIVQDAYELLNIELICHPDDQKINVLRDIVNHANIGISNKKVMI